MYQSDRNTLIAMYEENTPKVHVYFQFVGLCGLCGSLGIRSMWGPNFKKMREKYLMMRYRTI